MNNNAEVIVIDEYEILSGTLPDFLRDARENVDYIKTEIDENVSVYSITEEWLAGYDIRALGYRAIPKLYTVQAEPDGLDVFDTTALQILLDDIGIRSVQNPPLELTGDGVLIGMVDTGVRTELPIFRNQYGESRIVALWDQTSTEGRSPEGFDMGSVWYTEVGEGIPRIGREGDTSGHGTALASIMAVASPLAKMIVVRCRQAKGAIRSFYGVSEDAECYAESDLIQGVKFLVEEANRRKMPLVILMAMGSNQGDHAGNGYLQEYLSRLAIRNEIAVVVCAGNEAAAAHHTSIVSLGEYSGFGSGVIDYFGNNGTLGADFYGLDREIELLVGEQIKDFTMECWFEVTSQIRIQIRTPGGEQVDGIDVRTGFDITPNFVFDTTELQVNSVLIEQGSGKSLVLFRFRNATQGVWSITIASSSILDGVPIQNIQLWLPMTDLLNGQCVFLKPIPTITVTEPGNTDRIITVGAYNPATGSIAPFSGRGPTAIGKLVPDLTAPGVRVPTALGEYTGTGVAASLTTSAVALFMEWSFIRTNMPYLSSESIKKYLDLGASRDTTLTYPNLIWGYGKLNLSNIFEKLAITNRT